MKHRLWVYVLMATIGCFICTSIYSSEKMTEYKSNWGKYDFQGRIDSIFHDEGYLIVSERKVVLVDLVYSGKRYITAVKSVDGKELNFEDLDVGDWVFVSGGRFPDRSVGARTIFLLPYRISKKEFDRYSELAIIQEWEYPTEKE